MTAPLPPLPCRRPGLAAPSVLQLNGVSAAGDAVDQFPLLEMLGTEQLPAHSVLLVTASHRLSRAPGLLQRLIATAQQHSIDIVVMLPGCGVLDALQQGGGYAASALGSLLCSQAGSSAAGLQALQEFDSIAARDHVLVQPAANSSPVLLAVALTRCSEPSLQAFLADERRAANFAAGRKASYCNALAPRLRAAAERGFEAYQAAAPATAPGQRGLNPAQEQAALVGLKAALEAQCRGGSQPEGPSADIGLGRRSSGNRDWQCRTCSCAPGSPSLQCRCDCKKCRLARESLSSCPAACDRGGACTCPPACPCCCQNCHRGGGGASASASGASNSGGTAAQQQAPQKRQCAVCAQPMPRASQVVCSDACYLQHCQAQGREPKRCPNGADCLAQPGPGLVLPGMVYGQAQCAACFNHAKNTKQQQQRQQKRQLEPAGVPAAGAAAAEGPPSAKRKTPAKKATVRLGCKLRIMCCRSRLALPAGAAGARWCACTAACPSRSLRWPCLLPCACSSASTGRTLRRSASCCRLRRPGWRRRRSRASS